MKRILAAILVLGLPALAPAHAAGAPQEDLRPLAAPSRVELIEREYAAQSRGGRIPDDQLAYYLEQVERGWGMQRVRQDISSSLHGQGRRGWNGSSWSGQTLVCSSDERRRRTCRTPFDGRPVLVENISGTRCVEGRNFGGGGGSMWVDGGCRGRFAQGRGQGWNSGGGWDNGPGAGQVVRCESRDNRQHTCEFRGRAVLVRQLSKTACVEGRTWGQRGGTLWVDDGCRGEFAQGRGSGPGRDRDDGYGYGRDMDYSVTCSSDDRRRRRCDWDRHQGRPVLVRQLSDARCDEGRTWGWDGASVWVDGGCRARFGVR